MEERLKALENLYSQVPKNKENYKNYLILLDTVMVLSKIANEERKKVGVLLTQGK